MVELTLFHIIFSIVVIVCFFVLCANVAKIKKSLLTTDANEYYLAKMMGDNEKAYYHLQRHLYVKGCKKDLSESEAWYFYQEFKELGMGIPKLKIFERCKEKEEWDKDE